MMLKQPGHFTSIKKERGAGTRVYRLENIHQISDMGVNLVSKEIIPSACACGPQRRERG